MSFETGFHSLTRLLSLGPHTSDNVYFYASLGLSLSLASLTDFLDTDSGKWDLMVQLPEVPHDHCGPPTSRCLTHPLPKLQPRRHSVFIIYLSMDIWWLKHIPHRLCQSSKTNYPGIRENKKYTGPVKTITPRHISLPQFPHHSQTFFRLMS